MYVPVMARPLRDDYFDGPNAFEGLYCPSNDKGMRVNVTGPPVRLNEIRFEEDPFSLNFLFRDGQFPQSCFYYRCQIDTVIPSPGDERFG